MNTRKHNAMMNAYTGFRGTQTVSDIISRIPEYLKEQLTGKQLGEVMNLINATYHDGKAKAGAWREEGLIGYDNKAIPTAILDKIEVKNTEVPRYIKGISPVAGRNYLKDGETYTEIPETSTAHALKQSGKDVYYKTSDSYTLVSYDGKEIARHAGIL